MTRSLRSILSLAGACTLTLGASAADTLLITQVSTNSGASWSASVPAAAGATVLVRVRVVLANTTTAPAGLAGITFQPRLSGVTPGDGIQALHQPCGEVPVTPMTGTGRVTPFADTTTLPGVDCLQVLTDGTGAQRIAQGDSTGLTDVANGIPCHQVRQMLAGTNFNSSTDVVVFRYAVVVGSTPGCRALTLTVPIESVLSARSRWYAGTGGLEFDIPVIASNIAPATIIITGPPPTIADHPKRLDAQSTGAAAFTVTATTAPGLIYAWSRNGAPLSDGPRISGATTPTLVLSSLSATDAGNYTARVTNPCGGFVTSLAAPLFIDRCIGDVDDGTGSGLPDGGVTIEDLLHYLLSFDSGC